MATRKTTARKIDRTSKGLANMLFDELDNLNSGASTVQQARAKAALVSQLVGVTRLEMDHARFVASQQKVGNAPKALTLG